MAEQDTQEKPARGFGMAEFGAIVRLVLVFVVMLLVLFWPAGTIDWRRGWLFYSLFVVLTFIAMSWLARDNPELFAVRRKFQKGTKRWDAIVASLVILCFFAVMPVAALDDARFKWASLPDWAVLIGYAALIGGFMGTTWAQSVNRHFETTVRIQTDRDHKVIETGPYKYIRHPGYAFGSLMVTGMALSLGSGWALVPAGIGVLLVAGRTLAEEAVLRKGLPGYVEYAQKVKHRWIPLIW